MHVVVVGPVCRAMHVFTGDKPVVVDFMAGWCGKCRMIAPFVDELAEKHPGLVSGHCPLTPHSLPD